MLHDQVPETAILQDGAEEEGLQRPRRGAAQLLQEAVLSEAQKAVLSEAVLSQEKEETVLSQKEAALSKAEETMLSQKKEEEEEEAVSVSWDGIARVGHSLRFNGCQ